MLKYAAQRLAMMVGILTGVLTITFALSRVLPGSPIVLMLGHKPTPEQIEEARIALGLDQPIVIQFWNYLSDAVQGDFGISLMSGRPVLEEVALRFGATFELTTLAVIVVVLVGIPLGIVSAVRQNSPVDHLSRTASIAGVALPFFMTGMILQMIFHGGLGWLPLQGRIGAEMLLDHPFDRVTGLYLMDTLIAGEGGAFFSALAHIALPLLTLVIASLAVVTRITRSMMIEVLGEDYIRTARAYGYSSFTIHYRHALKATLIPMLTVVGLTYGYLLGSAVVVEFVFDWPGLGGYVVGAISRNDFPAVMGVTLLLSTIYLTINLVVDLLYYVADPRLRTS
jgi:peptide/nickel transport system permease protein